MEEAWQFEHSIECAVTKELAWSFWTDVQNWKLDADIEAVELHGPFAEGSAGATRTRSFGRVAWRIVMVKPGSEAVLEIPALGAILKFHWKFQDLGGRTRITQHVAIGGEAAAIVVHMIASGMQSGIPAGMEKLCASMVAAASNGPLPSGQ